jgi:GDPmannose 4,6-dehydratase
MDNAKRALITGVTGQDGSYLAENLLNKGYEVHGIRRRLSTNNNERISSVLENKNFHLHAGDIGETSSISSIIKDVDPHEIYNLAAQSHVGESFLTPEYTSNVDALGTLRILDSIRVLGKVDSVKFYQACTSEMFGKVQQIPQTEVTPFYPRSPYGVAKLYAYWITKNYRESYDMFATSGLLFNHESPRRGEEFVTQKIVKGMARIALTIDKAPIKLGNIDTLRDWGHAKDFVEAMWLILQQDSPEDYVIATGEQHSVREFASIAAAHFGFSLAWKGFGVDEIGYDENTGIELINISKEFFRPAEVDTLLGDPAKAKAQLGWEMKYSFEDLVRDMCESEANRNNV